MRVQPVDTRLFFSLSPKTLGMRLPVQPTPQKALFLVMPEALRSPGERFYLMYAIWEVPTN